MMPLPLALEFTGNSVTEQQFKAKQTQLIDYLAGLLGTSGNASDARLALGIYLTPQAYTARGNWVNGTAYAVNDYVVSDSTTFLCVNGVLASTPGSATAPGADSAHWQVLQGQTAAALAAGNGASLIGIQQPLAGAVPRTLDKKLREVVRVTDWGALGNGVHDDMSALLLAKNDVNYVHFPLLDGIATTYYLGAFAAGQLDSVTLSADVGVTLSVANNAPYALYKNITFGTDIRVFFRDIQDVEIFEQTPSVYKKESLPMPSTATQRLRKAIDCTQSGITRSRSVQWPTSEIFTDEIGTTKTSDTVSFPAAAPGKFRGEFFELGPYETISAFFDNGISVGPIGVLIRGARGYSVIYGTGGTTSYYAATKPTGADVINNTPSLSWGYLGQGVYASYQAENSVWSLSRISDEVVLVKLNGRELVEWTGLGAIFEVGFVCYNNAPFSLSGFSWERRTDAIYGRRDVNFHVYGDSTGERFPGGWDTHLKQLLDGAFGSKVGKVTNLAVVGWTLEQVFTRMQTDGFGDSKVVFMIAGTNNGQGFQPIPQFKSIIRQIIAYTNAYGVELYIIAPWMWYGLAQSGGIGQGATNYAGIAPYRIAMERIVDESTGCVLIKQTDLLPNPDPRLLVSEPGAAYLRDNIHKDGLGDQLLSRATSQAYADQRFSLPGSVEHMPPSYSFLSGASNLGDFRVTINKDGMASFSGSINVVTIADNTPVIRLPRWARPLRKMNFNAQALSSDRKIISGCYLFYDDVAHDLQLLLAPAGTAIVIIDAATCQTV